MEHIIFSGLHTIWIKLFVKTCTASEKACHTTLLLDTSYGMSNHDDGGECMPAEALVFAKAFDKISHDNLISKLHHYKIPSLLEQ